MKDEEKSDEEMQKLLDTWFYSGAYQSISFAEWLRKVKKNE